MNTSTLHAELKHLANQLAGDLLTMDLASSVFLFGSLARGNANRGSDIDMIVIVDEEKAAEWLARIQCFEIEFYHQARERLFAASQVLGQHWLLSGWGPLLDIFLFPPNWLSKLDELQRAGRHSDPSFMRNIAQDATRFDPELQTFPVFLQDKD